MLGGEFYAFNDEFNSNYMILHDLEKIYNRHIPLQMNIFKTNL